MKYYDHDNKLISYERWKELYSDKKYLRVKVYDFEQAKAVCWWVGLAFDDEAQPKIFLVELLPHQECLLTQKSCWHATKKTALKALERYRSEICGFKPYDQE